MWKRYLILVSAGWILSGCASLTTQSTQIPISESKLKGCQKLAQLESGSHNAVERWAVDAAFKYRECSDRLSELAEIVRANQKTGE
jgi:hypothetical protein